MKKIITILILFTFITACHEENKMQSQTLKLEENNQIILKNTPLNPSHEEINNDVVQTENEIKPTLPASIEEYNLPSNESNMIIKPNDDSIAESPETDTIDTESIDYPIHKGRIDCYDEPSCMSKSIPIQFQFKQSISNVFYLEVISKAGKTMGYFIEYNFKENKYSSLAECNNIGNEIKDTLTDRILSYECGEDGTLKIITDYGKE